MNWLAYNYAHDVKLLNSREDAVAFFMYPQAETRRDDATSPGSSATR
jgi:hypothetical protein